MPRHFLEICGTRIRDGIIAYRIQKNPGVDPYLEIWLNTGQTIHIGVSPSKAEEVLRFLDNHFNGC